MTLRDKTEDLSHQAIYQVDEQVPSFIKKVYDIVEVGYRLQKEPRKPRNRRLESY